MKKAALYVRKSTTDKQKNSFQVQLSNMRQYCEGHFEIVETFEDQMTGRTLDREGLNSAIEWLNGSSDRVLIVYKVDRLGRTLDDFQKIRWFIEGGRILFMDMHSPDSKADLLTIQIKLSLAEHESRMIGQRISSTIRHLQAQGVQWGKTKEQMSEIRSIGHKTSSKRSDTYTKKLLSKIEKINPDNTLTLTQVCEALNLFEIRTPRGGEWKPSYLCQVMKRAEKRGLKAA